LNLVLKIIKLFPPEAAHLMALYSLKALHHLNLVNIFFSKLEHQKIEFLGMTLANRLGTAAGLDKNGDFIDCIGAIGFGFVEVGTITPKAQVGNTKPRVFRIFEEEAIINQLGFNNKGVDYLVERLKKRTFKGVVGVNIGANKTSNGQKRIDDYIECFNKVQNHADYITVNISSPNTPGLRDLHSSNNLKILIESLDEAIKSSRYKKPIFLKVSPDENNESVNEIIQIVNDSSFTGLIVSNTSIDKTLLTNSEYHDYVGGLSGKPVMIKSTKLLHSIHSNNPSMPLIGVGGVLSKEDFQNKINSGAQLVQLYTGFVVKGPKIVSDILKD
jgi:dihydroorotate dehydrogenase